MLQPTPLQWVTVKTTLPALLYPPTHLRPPLRTARLVLRPYRKDDVLAIYAIRSQPEVMRWSLCGKPDANMDSAARIVESKLSADGERNVNYVVCLGSSSSSSSSSSSEGVEEVIGTCGVHRREGNLGWPVLGYMLRKEAWGKGYATEMVRAVMAAWWALRREEAQIQVDASTLDDGEETEEEEEEVVVTVTVRECITAVTLRDNAASRSVLSKVSFSLKKILMEPDLRGEEADVDLYCHVAKRPERPGVLGEDILR